MEEELRGTKEENSTMKRKLAELETQVCSPAQGRHAASCGVSRRQRLL